jgi:TonB family protein
MNSRAFAIFTFLVMLLVPAASRAQSAYLSSKGTAAIDAKGVLRRSSDHPDKLPPWMADRVKSVAPDFPYSERAQHHVGVGYVRLTLDLKTGAVTNVTVVKSTGFATLDNCAVAAFRQWRWKPGKWKEIDTPVTFRLASTDPHMPPGSVPLPLR